MKKEPAYTIIKFLGGANNIARILCVHPSWVYRWWQPKEKKGCVGIIPSRHQITLLKHCRENGIDLRPDDFFDPSRLQGVLEQQEKGSVK